MGGLEGGASLRLVGALTSAVANAAACCVDALRVGGAGEDGVVGAKLVDEDGVSAYVRGGEW